MTSFWDGRARAPLRAGLAAAAALDLLELAAQLRVTHPSAASHPLAPALLLALGGHRAAIVLGAGVGLGALLCFAAGRAQLGAGALALGVLAFFAESQAALLGGPRRSVFAVGAMLLGWLAGLAWGRGLGGGAAREDLAEAGAVATLAATYLAAATSKLMAQGLRWADASTLRALLLSQHRVSERGWSARLVAGLVEHPGLCRALALATLAIQLGAFLYLVSPGWRVVLGSLLLLFHLTVSELTGITYAANLALLTVFSFPWPQLLPPGWMPVLPDTPPRGRDPRDPIVERRVLLAALSILVAAVGLAWLLPVRDYTSLYNPPL